MRSFRNFMFDRLIARSSLGTPQARALQVQTPPEVAEAFRRGLDFSSSQAIMRRFGYTPTYTRRQFDEARDTFIAECGYDPIGGWSEYGWENWCYYSRRFQYWAPWQTTEPWDARWDSGTDENCNPSLIFVLPKLLGTIVIFPSIRMRTWHDGPCGECFQEMSQECDLCPLCMAFHRPACLKINP